MWSILWSRFHIWKSFKLCWTKSCYTPPTKPRSAPDETALHWCATPCGNTFAGWNSGPVKSVTARATRGIRKPTRRHGVGNRRLRGRKNNQRKNRARRSSALSVCPARQKAAGPGAHAQQRDRVSIHRHGGACHVDDSRRAFGSCAERGGWHEGPMRGKPAQRRYRFAAAPGEACGPAQFRTDE
jgi:hypothetical protein